MSSLAAGRSMLDPGVVGARIASSVTDDRFRLSEAVDGRLQWLSILDPHGLASDDQQHADRQIAALEREAIATGPGRRTMPLCDEWRFPSMPAWMGMRKSALALHTLYRAGTVDRLAWGLSADVFARPLLDGRSPLELLADQVGSERASRIAARHKAFLRAPMTLEARLITAGSADGRAIRARAALAATLIEQRLLGRRDAVRLGSVACGAAGPIAETGRVLADRGVPVAGLSLLDRDPMALAAARAVASAALPEIEPRLCLVDLVDLAVMRAVDLGPYAEDGWDVVDILGLFEYLPDVLAVDLLRNAVAVCRPGGVVVVANMLADRPQQTFFSRVVQWPSVIQRSPVEFADLIAAAGIAHADVSFLACPEAPVYAVAGIRV